LHAGTHEKVPYPYGNKDSSEVHFVIINVENDEKVLSEMHKNEAKILAKPNARILGLRDMYSKRYRDISHGTIDLAINKKFVEQYAESISKMSNPDRVSFHFAIMEVESWWLSMVTIFEKIDLSLTVEHIDSIIGVNLK
jgi:hypothetical protein